MTPDWRCCLIHTKIQPQWKKQPHFPANFSLMVRLFYFVNEEYPVKSVLLYKGTNKLTLDLINLQINFHQSGGFLSWLPVRFRLNLPTSSVVIKLLSLTSFAPCAQTCHQLSWNDSGTIKSHTNVILVSQRCARCNYFWAFGQKQMSETPILRVGVQRVLDECWSTANEHGWAWTFVHLQQARMLLWF